MNDDGVDERKRQLKEEDRLEALLREDEGEQGAGNEESSPQLTDVGVKDSVLLAAIAANHDEATANFDSSNTQHRDAEGSNNGDFDSTAVPGAHSSPESDLVSKIGVTGTSIPEAIDPKASNPFDEDESPKVPDDRGRRVIESSSSNPFAGDDETADSLTASNYATSASISQSNLARANHSHGRNPFDDEEKNELNSASVVASGTQVSAVIPIPSGTNQSTSIGDIAPSDDAAENAEVRSGSRVSSSEVPQKTLLTLEQKVNFLILMGFNPKAAARAIEVNNSLRAAVKVLGYEASLREGQSLRGDGMFVWKPPISATVGSWLPSQPAEDGSTYVTYIVTVSLRYVGRSDHSFQIEKRYSEFYNLYCALYDIIYVLLPSGLTNPFPDDRWSSWLWGGSEQRNDQRRAGLDAWLREVVASIPIMTTLESFVIIRDFLDIKYVLE